MAYPEIPSLPEILKDLKDHLKECPDCFMLAKDIKDKAPKMQLDLITRILKMHDNKPVRVRLLGRDKAVYLKIPERLWDDCKEILAENKIRISQYEITSVMFAKIESKDLKEQKKKRDAANVIRIALDPDSDIPYDPPVSNVFRVYEKSQTEPEYPEITQIKAERDISGLSISQRLFGSGSSNVPSDDTPNLDEEK